MSEFWWGFYSGALSAFILIRGIQGIVRDHNYYTTPRNILPPRGGSVMSKGDGK